MGITHAISGHLLPWPLGVMIVSLLVAAFALVWVQRMAFGLRACVPPVSWPHRHDKVWGEKSVGGSGGAILVIEGSVVGLCQPALARTGLEVGSDM
jgi:hypothetical protein